MSNLIDRQKAIDAVCSVCGCDCDKSEFVYDAPQDEQVILCPEHYALTSLPSAQPESCEGCIQYGLWENEIEYGYPNPCTRCKRRANDNYER